MDKKILKYLKSAGSYLSKYKKKIIIGVIVIGVGGTWYYLNLEDDADAEPVIKKTEYKESKVTKQDIKLAIEAEGQVAAETATLNFKQNGEIEEILVSVGDHVDVGTELAKIDNTDLSTRSKEALYSYYDAVDQRDAKDTDANQRKVNTTYLAYQSAKEDLAEATLTSTVAGEVVEINVGVGDSTSSGSQNGFILIKKDVSGPKMTLSLDETEVINVAKDIQVYATFENIKDPIP